ncbi:uncharacterized protein SOCEGT47_043810 [Sorangium cellulosum]|uniref:Uncharacterized protein n=1 Tax=Sorangium cellulosum TaxID=56 RepID=A0A4P2Q3X1_SORCE|nr:hypothetical protein [Sorangium cellulosum]AUX23851.1 uncharacterized protein SOCEGT47_043810 [Sorangium cellulosum]
MNSKPPISERGLHYLVENGCMPPGWRRDVLLDWLAQHGVPRLDVLIAWEEALHDIRNRLYLPRSSCASSEKGCRKGISNDLLLLPGSLSYRTMRVYPGGRIPNVREHEGVKLVLFGESISPARYFYMDQAGRVFEVTPWRPCHLVAQSPFVHLERAILEAMTLKAEAQLRCQGNVADKLASALDVPVIPEASDELEQSRGDGRFILQQRDPRYTDVFVLSLEDAPLVLGALKQLGVRAFMQGPAWANVSFEPLEEAPPLGEPAADAVVPLWSFGGIRGSIAMEGDTIVQTTGRRSEVRRRIIGKDQVTEVRRCLVTKSELGMFSPRARKYLLAVDARRDPVEIPEADELERMLRAWGLPSYPALVDFHASWAGFAWGNAETPNQLGTFGLLLASFPPPDPPIERRKPGSPPSMSLEWEGRELVMIGATQSTTMFLDHDGSIVEHEAYENQLFPSASSIVKRIEFEATLETVTGVQYLEGACGGFVGRELADALGLAPVPEASDTVRAWWIGEHVSVYECYSPVSGERMTAIFADNEELHEHAMQLGKSLKGTP